MTSYCYFRVRCSTNYKEQVKIAGNIPELGSWDVKKAFCLTTDESVYPNWNNQERLILNQSYIEFKVIIERGDEATWESIPNRVLEIKHFKQIVFISFDNPQVEIIPLKKELQESMEFEQEQLNDARKINVLELSHDNSSFYENNDDDGDINGHFLGLGTHCDSFDLSENQESFDQFSSSPLFKQKNDTGEIYTKMFYFDRQ